MFGFKRTCRDLIDMHSAGTMNSISGPWQVRDEVRVADKGLGEVRVAEKGLGEVRVADKGLGRGKGR